MPVTRTDLKRGRALDDCLGEINRMKRELELMEEHKNLLFSSMSQNAQESQVVSAPKFWHAEAVLKWVGEGNIAKEHRTVSRAVNLMNDGLLPGVYFDKKIKISSRYVSEIKGKIVNGQELYDTKGKPSHLDNFDVEFIRDVLESQQLRCKSVLLSTVQLLVRVIVLIKKKQVTVDALDERVEMKMQRPKKRPKKKVARARPAIDSSDTDSDDDDPGAAATAESFETVKKILGQAMSMQIAMPSNSRFPTRRQVRKICKKHKWSVRKAQQTTPWRFEGCSPPMISCYFGNIIRVFVEFEIMTPGQKSNTDEKRLNAEFEKSGRCLSVVCVKPSEKLSGHGRVGMTSAASSRSIVGFTFLPFIHADGSCLLMIIIRKGDPNSPDSKIKEADIWNKCHAAYEKEGIELVIITTPSGYMVNEAFQKCVCHYMRVLLRRDGVEIVFEDPRNPQISELGALKSNQILFLDNASHHKLGEVEFRCATRIRGLQLFPLPYNTTGVSQPLDQDCNKLFTLWVQQYFLLEMQLEMSGGVKNTLNLVLWAQQIPLNDPAFHVPMCVEMDLTALASTGSADMKERIAQLNAVLAHANTSNARGFDEVRVATICIAPWLAALGHRHVKNSFVSVGLAAPDAVVGAVLRGRQTHLQLEHSAEMMARYEVFPERITSTNIYINAAEKWAKESEAAITSKFEMYRKGAMVVGALPDLQQQVVSGRSLSDNRDDTAAMAASLVFGPNPPQEALSLSKVILQAGSFVEIEQQKRMRVEGYQSRMPGSAESLEQQVQQLRESGLAAMHEKLKTVKRSFEIVSEHATVLNKACLKIENQWQSQDGSVQKLSMLLLSIHEMATKLKERAAELEAELAKKIESRDGFIAKTRADFVPDANLREAMGDELNADWGAGSLVRTTVLAVARVTEFVYYDVANKLAQCANAVDDDVFAVINDIFGDVGDEAA
jgi:hypothetical protein